MNFDPWVGLIAAGPVSPALARLPDLHTQLGPVAAASVRVASRIANQLKAGQPTRIEQLQSTSLLLVSGPESAIPALLNLARDAPWEWQNKTLVLLDTRLEGRDLQEFAGRGAAVATLDPIDGFGEVRFCVDGDAAALRQLKRFLGAVRAPYFTLEQGKKQVFSAGLAFTGTLATPLLAAAVDCFRNAGLDPKQAAALEEENSILGAYFAETAHMALELFGHDAAWLQALEQEAGPEEPPAKRRGAAAGGDGG
jgi:hypothetical protein